MLISDEQLEGFRKLVWERGGELYRDLPWRNTDDPYAILVSEVMLQQTQVSRVQGRWEEWLETFPTVTSLAEAPLPPVLELWQGMGYNRRAVNLKRCAEEVVSNHGGAIPHELDELVALPGIGPATAAGVRAFAFRLPGVYLETNVRTVFIHELFPGEGKVSDKDLIPLVEASCPEACAPVGRDVRAWYYALLDYGAHLKKTVSNPSRRSKEYSRQSAFEGSHRQKRALALRRILDDPCTVEELAEDLNAAEKKAGRPRLDLGEVEAILAELAKEGFIEKTGRYWACRE
ncbi:MAG: adenine glycosylase [Coriobacteriales bacterium]|jgi:A/G-specific adenine glycosylase